MSGDGERVIRSPLPGTFYRAATPEDDPYVADGGPVAPGDVIGLIEVMKMFTEVTAEEHGVVDHFLAESGDAVQAGQALVALGDDPPDAP
jgi:acetyl-CoA carboxylase biotin carboxyl carrier protein